MKTATRTARKPRPRPVRHARISKAVNGCYAMQLTVGKKTCFYFVEPIQADQGSAFKLIKWEEYREEGEPDAYHVNVNGLLARANAAASFATACARKARAASTSRGWPS